MNNDEKQQAPKPDCVLSDGTEVFFDKRNIRPREWKSLFDPEQAEEDAAAIVARFSGLPFERVMDLSVYDSQLIYAAMRVKILEPVDLKNSPSVSISPS